MGNEDFCSIDDESAIQEFHTIKKLREELDAFVEHIVNDDGTVMIGFPSNQNINLIEFYKWYTQSKLFDKVSLNNVANPKKESPVQYNSHLYENKVVNSFANLCGFESDESWGIVTFSGSDGNNHGLYYGTKYLVSETGERPIVYVSHDAHYSIRRLADLQNLDVEVIPTDEMGHMDMLKFEEKLNVSKPALIVLTLGTTFKGAMDDQQMINQVIAKKNPVGVYRHIDAALFGGFLIFEESNDIINAKVTPFDSIAISGHKFFGLDEPMGVFVTTKKVFDHLNPLMVEYLNDAVPTITCSRSGLAPLKFWWKLEEIGIDGYRLEAKEILDNAEYLEERLSNIQYQSWRNPHSNTVFFKQPEQWIVKKWSLALEKDSRLTEDKEGLLSHVVVMQHVTKEVIDKFIEDIESTL